MKRWIRLAAALYPRSWCEQYGTEFEALLDDVAPSPRVFVNVLEGAIRMRMAARADWLKVLAATAALGAIVGLGVSWTVKPSYVSSATIGVTPQPDPWRPVSPQALRERAAADFARMEAWVLCRQSLSILINDPSLDLYRKERRQVPLDVVEDVMRRDIRIEARPSNEGGLAPLIFRISFSYPDRVKSQATVRALARQLTLKNAEENRDRASAYQSLWQDLATEHLAKPVPPPPLGESVGIVSPPGLPKRSAVPGRIAFVGWGLGAGLLVCLLAALVIEYPRAAWQLGGFAFSGCVLATAVSFLIPNRFTATAVIEITPTRVAEDPLAPLPQPTPAAEFLRQMEPRVISTESLANIIQDPVFHLYPEARDRKSIEDLVRDMRASIHIAPLNSVPAEFSISFSYPERREVVMVVNALTSRFVQEADSAQRASAANATQREILSRHAGEYIGTLNQATTPFSPDSPNRPMIAEAGLAGGFLIGVICLPRRRPTRPVAALNGALT